MPTDAQREASRANGAKSQGPKTHEGKARSSRNSLKHGMAAKSLVYTIEDPGGFRELVDGYYDEFIPQNQSQCNLLDDFIPARSQHQRALANEVSQVEL